MFRKGIPAACGRVLFKTKQKKTKQNRSVTIFSWKMYFTNKGQIRVLRVCVIIPHASPYLTNNDRLRWKTDFRLPANGPPTTASQKRRHIASTTDRGPPRPPTPRPSPQLPPPHSRCQGQVPITQRFFFKMILWLQEAYRKR
jgi:hypothetical protein